MPHEVVTDMSIALISACVRTFTPYNSLANYLDFCYSYLITHDHHKHPSNNLRCYLRTDVAHVIRIICGWHCLKSALRRSRHFYKRCMGQLIQARNIKDVRVITRNIFTVALNETDGFVQNKLTPCSVSKNFLRNLIGNEDNTDEDDEGEFDTDNIEMEAEELENNNFIQWGHSIRLEVEAEICKGNEDNCQYLPDIVTKIIQFLKYLPLWSHVMSTAFPHSQPTTSSAVVESSFNDIKHRLFSNFVLPIRVDEFIVHHINGLEGTIKLAMAQENVVEVCETHEEIEHPKNLGK